MSNKSKLLGALIVLVLIFIDYRVSQKSNTTSDITGTAGTSAWQTYANTDYSINYPKTWIVDDQSVVDVHISSREYTENREKDADIVTIEIQQNHIKSADVSLFTFTKS